MVDTTAPLTDEERAELEQLRKEKAERERLEMIRAERSELERLRAESSQYADGAKPHTVPETESQEQVRPEVSVTAQEQARRESEARERGRRLMEPDDDLKMPMGQKITLLVIALIVITVICSTFFMH